MDTKTAARMIPYSGGPKRLAFQIRRFRTYGSTSLLTTNRFGVWSAVRCRHIKKTRHMRFNKLKGDAGHLEKGYVSRLKLGSTDEQVTSWRRSLADFYWDAAPPAYKAGATDYFRRERWDRRILHFVV